MILLKKPIKLLLILLITILIMSGCESQKEDSIVVSFENPETGQLFEIVNVYKLYKDFFDESSKENQPKDINELYKTKIIDRVYDQCFAEGKYLYMVNDLLNHAPTNESELSKLIENIDIDSVNKFIKDSLIKSSNLLPSKGETTVCVFPTLEEGNSMVTVGAGKIIALYQEGYTEDIIKTTIAHEYHHSVWTEKFLQRQNGVTLLDNLIFEGKAVMFENLVYPGKSIISILPYYSSSQWEKFKPLLHKQDLELSVEILNGGGELPLNYGYQVGYKMVKSYLDLHPDLTPAEWIGIDAEEIYDEIEFPPSF
ncbi:DUF2268 domain-containing putative Zn-dependent protease [Ornithinibacillus contaminans]|uniref:DUF2268 domain-containing putative Zn-dependent protease n=1 Tax=Ornithinibacillus contaminans TaxID=694055 RepID=UPI000A717ADC|nr:DUF2268 domain-containing putative Zn-dependent protease [Ornithinibacillus contaminans]